MNKRWQVTTLSQGSKGRDARALMQLREKFIMLSHADRCASNPTLFSLFFRRLSLVLPRFPSHFYCCFLSLTHFR